MFWMWVILLLDIFIKLVKIEVFWCLCEILGGQVCFGKLVCKKLNCVFCQDLVDEVMGELVLVFDVLVVEGIFCEMMFEELKFKFLSKIEVVCLLELMVKLKVDGVCVLVVYIKVFVVGVLFKLEGGIIVVVFDDFWEVVDVMVVVEGDFDVYDGEESVD